MELAVEAAAAEIYSGTRLRGEVIELFSPISRENPLEYHVNPNEGQLTETEKEKEQM